MLKGICLRGMGERGVERAQLRVVHELERDVQAERTQEARHARRPHVNLPGRAAVAASTAANT